MDYLNYHGDHTAAAVEDLGTCWTCFGREEPVYLLILPWHAVVGQNISVIVTFIIAEVCATKRFVHSEMACICLSCHQLLSEEDPKDRTDVVSQALCT